MHVGDEISYEKVLCASKKIWPSRNTDLAACGSIVAPDEDRCDETFVRSKDISNRRQLRCHCCNRIGHIRKDCRVQCYNCRQTGHNMKAECAKFRSAVPLNTCVGAASASVAETVLLLREESVLQQRLHENLH